MHTLAPDLFHVRGNPSIAISVSHRQLNPVLIVRVIWVVRTHQSHHGGVRLAIEYDHPLAWLDRCGQRPSAHGDAQLREHQIDGQQQGHPHHRLEYLTRGAPMVGHIMFLLLVVVASLARHDCEDDKGRRREHKQQPMHDDNGCNHQSQHEGSTARR
eukprot:scaffold30517_cov53-Phaeocystis_antarctica.AAC.2